MSFFFKNIFFKKELKNRHFFTNRKTTKTQTVKLHNAFTRRVKIKVESMMSEVKMPKTDPTLKTAAILIPNENSILHLVLLYVK